MAKKVVSKTAAARKRKEAAQRKALRVQAEQRIDEVLRGAGFENPEELVDEDGWRCFPIAKDLDGFAFVDVEGPEVTFNVVADLMPLPSDPELVVPLMRELLETNDIVPGPARFAISGDAVRVVATEMVEDMADADYQRFCEAVVGVAEAVAADFRKRYGGAAKKRKTKAR